jgi:hypothetical protein
MKKINFIYRAKKVKQHRYKYYVVCTDGSVYEVPRERIAKVLYAKRISLEMLTIFEGLDFLWNDLL